eukprot:scaffold59565_cov23-Tisochrysis_lutea.AAC.4
MRRGARLWAVANTTEPSSVGTFECHHKPGGELRKTGLEMRGAWEPPHLEEQQELFNHHLLARDED